MAAHFGDDLAFSHAESASDYWHRVYKQAFPDISEMVEVKKDGWAQRGGIDRIIVTGAGRVWCVDEKVRKKRYDDDILLEFIADLRTGEKGWVEKDVACDFIAYVKPLAEGGREVFLLPVLLVQRAWRQNKKKWLAEYGIKDAPNEFQGRRWTTRNCPVPVGVLMRAISVACYFRCRASVPAEQAVAEVEQ